MTTSREPVVVITGANAGIGYHLMKGVVENGYRVAGLDVTDDAIRAFQEANSRRVRPIVADVADADAVGDAVGSVIDAWGRIDILVNNAAVATLGRIEDRSLADSRREFAVNVFGYLHTIRAVLPHMRSRGRGIIHNVGSPVGTLGHSGLSDYAATKGAITGLTRSLRMELRGSGITCTLVIPPTTKTDMTAGMNYPAWMTADPADVGRKLARKIDSTRPVITPDFQTRVGTAVFRRSPRLWAAIVDRYVDLDSTDGR